MVCTAGQGVACIATHTCSRTCTHTCTRASTRTCTRRSTRSRNSRSSSMKMTDAPDAALSHLGTPFAQGSSPFFGRGSVLGRCAACACAGCECVCGGWGGTRVRVCVCATPCSFSPPHPTPPQPQRTCSCTSACTSIDTQPRTNDTRTPLLTPSHLTHQSIAATPTLLSTGLFSTQRPHVHALWHAQRGAAGAAVG